MPTPILTKIVIRKQVGIYSMRPVTFSLFFIIIILSCKSQTKNEVVDMNPIDTNTSYELTRLFPANPDQLFGALIDSSILKQIWGVQSITVDARPEGIARAVYRIGEQNWDFTITYKEVIPNQKLGWIVHFDSYPTKETKVTILMNKVSAGTELKLRMENFENSQERNGNRQAWESALLKLAEILKSA
jgi:uncharacterized protein YndB with AHSA1/START domain